MTVQVVVEQFDDAAKALGLNQETAKTDVELKMRLAGMHVLSDEEATSAPGRPYFYVNVTVSDNGKAATVEVQLIQEVRLVRNGELAVAATWSRNGISTNPNASAIRGFIKDGVDAFLNAWLSVNPKK